MAAKPGIIRRKPKKDRRGDSLRTIIASSRTLNPPRLTRAEHNLAMKQFTRPRISPSYLNACFMPKAIIHGLPSPQIGYLFKDLYRQVIIRSPKKLGYFRSRWAHRDPKRSDPSVKFLACLSYLRSKVSFTNVMLVSSPCNGYPNTGLLLIYSL